MAKFFEKFKEVKMLALSFDTATPCLTVGLSSEETMLNEISLWAPRAHMARLLPVVDLILKLSEKQIRELKVIFVGIGPGSFTGLRIGISVARTLGQLLKIPIVGVPTLDAIAYRFLETGIKICPVVDAKRGEVYTSFYSTEKETLIRLIDFLAIKPQQLIDKIKQKGDKVILVGDGLLSYGQVFKKELGELAKFAPVRFWYPSSIDLAALGWSKWYKQEYKEFCEITPLYVRLPQAEEVWQGRESSISSRD
jgi:tRNA threonylcarbamoyl adenosine modification protein YeaZ